MWMREKHETQLTFCQTKKKSNQKKEKERRAYRVGDILSGKKSPWTA
jgi:hypothetical protein